MTERTSREKVQSASDENGSFYRTDGGEDGGRILRYGTTAEAIGRPDDVFGKLGDRYVLIPQHVLDWSIIADNEIEPGVAALDDLSHDSGDVIAEWIEWTELDELIHILTELTDLSEEEAGVLLLSEGLEFERDEIAAELGLTQSSVGDHLRSIRDRYDGAHLVGQLVEQAGLSEQQARILVNTQVLGLTVEEVSEKLDMPLQDVEFTLETIETEHDNIDLAEHRE